MQHSIQIRVQYHETDGQGRVHHAQYLTYMERGRVELMRSLGYSYREFESSGLMLVVSKLEISYLGAAAFDDLLRLTTRVERTRGVRIEHSYQLSRVDSQGHLADDIVVARTTIACIDHSGKVARLPDYLRVG
jgi:acyl-CoA thioester hydrolase